jgi:hypothetical protein
MHTGAYPRTPASFGKLLRLMRGHSALAIRTPVGYNLATLNTEADDVAESHPNGAIGERVSHG